MGSKWSEISKNLVGRPENKVKNRFYSYIQKNYDIKFKEVENIDPQLQTNETNKKLYPFELKPAYQPEKVEHILQEKSHKI